MNKTLYKFRFITGLKHDTTKPVSSLLTRCFLCIKSKEEKYYSTIFNNRMCILKNSPTLLSAIKSVSALQIILLCTPLFHMLNLKVESADLSGSHLI